MTTESDSHAQTDLQICFDGNLENLKKTDLVGERVISAGRAVGLALELGQPTVAQALWSKEVPNVTGMPTLEDFREGYETHKEEFGAFEIGREKAFTVPGTVFSNAVGCYARALKYAVAAQKSASEDSVEYWAGEWGSDALTAAGFPEQAAQLKHSIRSGVALEVKARGASPAG